MNKSPRSNNADREDHNTLEIVLKEDFETYQKFNVCCKYCASSKLLTADTRTSSNLLKHLELNLMIQNMIINASLPFNLVEQINFKNLITTGYPNRHVFSRKISMKNIEAQHQVFLQNMKSIFFKVNYLTTTADCWTIFKSITRESCLLAIRRSSKDSHTYDLLARTMESIFTEFNINDKVIYTTTDNSFNFVKCFEMFGQSSGVEIVQDRSKKTDVEILKTLEDSIAEEYDKNKEDTDDDGDSKKDEDVSFSRISITKVLDDRELIGECTSNWDDCMDIEKALSPNVSKRPSMLNYRKQSRLTLSKCQALWNKQNRSSQIADIIKINLGVYLKTPNQTCWNCWFDSSKILLLHFKNSPSKFTKVCDALKLNRFSKNDLEFFEEYVVVMEPFCICLDVLQGEKNMYFGFLLPSITILLQKYDDIAKKNLTYCDSLVSLIKANMEKRFENFLTDPFLLSATVSHPFFKTIWLTNNDKNNKALSFFKKSCLEMFEQSNFPESEVSERNMSDYANDYFNWSENKSKVDLS
ncbi:hypothetical protein QTP88_027264 [Uroleucon formosanum]